MGDDQKNAKSSPPAGLTASALEKQWTAQIESGMRVVSPLGWGWMGLISAVVAATAVWSVLGVTPTKLAGSCILMSTGGVWEVTSNAAGRVSELKASLGERVKAGQAIAFLAQPELDDRIEKAAARLRDLESRRTLSDASAKRGAALNEEVLAEKAGYLARQRALVKTRLRIAGEQVGTNKELLEQGLITRQAFQAATLERSAVGEELKGIDQQLAEIGKARMDAQKRERDERAALHLQIADAGRELEGLQKQREYTARVESPYDGRLVELKAGKDMLVEKNAAIASIERADGPEGRLEAVMFVPATEGKKLERNMPAEIFPATTRREESGFVRGKVRFVSDYPATPQSLATMLANDDLARELSGSVAPFEVRIALERTSSGGFQWSRELEHEPALKPGTLCRGEVRVREERPIGFVIPALKRAGF